MATVTTLSLPKMDCPTEERLIRMTLEPQDDVQYVSVDLDRRILEVTHSADPSDILDYLLPLRLGASLVGSKTIDASEVKDPSTVNESLVLHQLLWINFLMFLVELVGGVLAHSTGLLADSLDMLGDAFVYGVALTSVGKGVRKQKNAARYSGVIQLFLAVGVLFEVVRRFYYGSEPQSVTMILVASMALFANLFCIWLLRNHREGGAHMKASWIFSTNDAIANLGMIIAGVLVLFTQSSLPDLAMGLAISVLVTLSALRILRLARV